MIAVIGEALVDLVSEGRGSTTYHAMVGGSPYNVARAAARQEVAVSLYSQVGDDVFGRQLMDAARADGVDLTGVVRRSSWTGLAVTGIGVDGSADYEFRLDDADTWTARDLAGVSDASIVHFGSIASWRSPQESIVQAAVRRATGLVTYDPNVRPLLMGARASAVQLVERNVAGSDLVKASNEDLAFLYPGTAVADIAGRWLRLGAQVVVVTAGADGISAYREADAPVHRPAAKVAVVDTVGAGDCAMATLLTGLVARDITGRAALAELDDTELSAMVDDAALAAAVTCSRRGAEPPTADELREARLIIEAAD